MRDVTLVLQKLRRLPLRKATRALRNMKLTAEERRALGELVTGEGLTNADISSRENLTKPHILRHDGMNRPRSVPHE